MAETKKEEKTEARSGTIHIDVGAIEHENNLEPVGGSYEVSSIKAGMARMKAAVEKLNKTGIPKVVWAGTKGMARIFLWSVRQLLLLIGEGIKGMFSGIAEANRELNADMKGVAVRGKSKRSAGPSFIDHREYHIYMPKKKKTRPFWHIPSKEEEMMEKMGVFD
jgi:hypothetical protein